MDSYIESRERSVMEPKLKRFLTAEWLDLAFLNFDIDPAVLRLHVPAGTELDLWQGRALASLVGFRFHNTRLWNLAIPFHGSFEEVNLRFYVRRNTPAGWRRGVVFIRELVPRRAVSWVARICYHENYRTVPMGHRVEIPDNGLHGVRRAAYWWRLGGEEHRIEVGATCGGRCDDSDGEAEFITDQAWGYSGRPGRRTIEYRVDHPRWTIWRCNDARFTGDVERVYGQQFVEALSASPASAFYADGSEITLYRGTRLRECVPC